MSSSRSLRMVASSAAFAMLATACFGGGSDDSGPTTTVPAGASNTPIVNTAGASTGVVDASGRLGIRLSEGTASAPAVSSLSLVEGTPLTDAEIDAILARLPEWDVPPTDVQTFNRPPDSLKPPLAGETIGAPFPPAPTPPSTPDATADGPLEVLRYQPEGAVDVAPFLAVTFNEPMVPLATLEQLDSADVPVTLTPSLADLGVDGRWRWIGTRTLRFEVLPGVIDRLPAATDYTVEIPAGTASANGAVLDQPFTWRFSTPPPTVTSLSGFSDSMGLDPVFVVSFDQRVDPAAAIEAITLNAGDVGSVRLATPAEIDAADGVRNRLDAQLDDRAFAFVPTEQLAPGTPVTIAVGPGVPSLEGARTSTERYSDTGSTYGPLRVDWWSCRDGSVVPLESFAIVMTNALDPDAFRPEFVTVEPGVPGLRVDLQGPNLTLSGATSGSTDYTITLSGDMIDVFGQTLGDDVSVTCRVGPATPFLSGPNRPFVTTDPFADTPGLTVATVNHDSLRVVAWQVAPGQYDEYQRYLDNWYSDTRPADPDWPVVLDTVVTIDAPADEITETVVDLSSAFDASNGPVVVRVEAVPEVNPRSNDYWQNRPVVTWVQQTTLGVDALVMNDELLVWTTDLLTGAPVGGAQITLLGSDRSVTTDADGLARAELSSTGIIGLSATAGDRAAMLPSQAYNGWQRNITSDQTRWYVIDDRGVYRPGETARLLGFVRNVTTDDAQLALFGGSAAVGYTAYDPFGNEIASGSAAVNALGGFDIEVDIPEASNTGYAYVELRLTGVSSSQPQAWSHGFQVEDFRTPEFEVTTRQETADPLYVVTPATVAVDAEYYAGGPLPDAEVNWLVSTSDTTYRPPNWDEFNFGIWTPWWYGGYGVDYGFDVGYGGAAPEIAFEECWDCGPTANIRYEQFSGRTNANGTHYLQIDFSDSPPPVGVDGEPQPVDQPTSVTAEATVFDLNRQAFASRTSLLVHPAKYYVGLRSDRSFVEQGQPIVIDTAVVDVDGQAIAGRTIEVTAGRLESGFREGRYVDELVDPQTCTVTSTTNVSNDAPDPAMRCEFPTEVGGQYQVTAIVKDDDGRQNRAVYTQWVSGATAPPTRNLEQGQVTIVPDRETYAPGDTAELLVQAPFAEASGLLTVTRAGIESTTVFATDDGSAVLAVPIADDDIPNLQVRVDMVGSTERTADDGAPLPNAPQRPAFATGEIRLSIPPVSRTLERRCDTGCGRARPRQFDVGERVGHRPRRRAGRRCRCGPDRGRRGGPVTQQLPADRSVGRLLSGRVFVPLARADPVQHHPVQSRSPGGGRDRRRRGWRGRCCHRGARSNDRAERRWIVCHHRAALRRAGSPHRYRRAHRLRCACGVRARRDHSGRRLGDRCRGPAGQPHSLPGDGGRRLRG